ncbi:helix-turn-helix domain-containing protein [Geofilum sp. OHC36d9]|uniref:helix-turn-helix domain-containing protein n=1 Tax=Geofilum sp. OHC36d9 TaxID=3458413 RepID=UPI0040333C44
MINYNFNKIFKARGVERPFSFLIKAGFSHNFSTKIKNNKVRQLGLKELEKLCLLLRCTPNDFLVWTPDGDETIDSNHPLQSLRQAEKVFDLTRTLNSLPLKELDRIQAFIDESIKQNG